MANPDNMPPTELDALTDIPGVSVRGRRHRVEILAVLADSDRFRTAGEVHRELVRRGAAIGRVTVYRHLHELAGSHAIHVLHQANGQATYRRCSPQPHQHLVCVDCARTVEISDQPIRDWASAVAQSHGFVDIEVNALIYGRCGCALPSTTAASIHHGG